MVMNMPRYVSLASYLCLTWMAAVAVGQSPSADESPSAGQSLSAGQSPSAGQSLSAGPLWAAIDQAIALRASGRLSESAADSQFLRRAYLDLAGEIPPSWLAREFPADLDPSKRERLVERLTQGPAFARRMREAWTVMLLERHEGKTVPDEDWEAYLESAFLKGKPWDELARELVAADGFEELTRPAIRLLADGSRSDPHSRTQDFARLFLGMNLQCAQCHDHPTIADYKQSHYFGLFAFLSPTKLVRDKQEQPRLVEAVVQAKADFVSVFHPDDKRAIGPRLLDAPEVAIPMVAKGEEFAIAPANGLPGVPRFQPRKLLAEQLSGSEAARRRFARNAVNRVWFLFMGRGLVHPLDLDHSANPPSHPELLERLTIDFIAHGYDLRWLARSICLSDAYQRSTERAAAMSVSASASVSKGIDVSAAQVTAQATQARQAKATQTSSYFEAATVRPLSPEQLARSLVRATGQRLAGESLRVPHWPPAAAIEGANGESAANATANAAGKPAGKAAGVSKLLKPDKPFTLKDYLNRRLDPPTQWRDVMVVFAGVFGHPAGQAEVDFRPSVEQALFLSNDPLIRAWLDPASGGLIGELLAAAASDETCVDELYLSFLSRLPEASERSAAIEWLRQGENRSETLRDLCLALICSSEFRFV
jgi:hypothetical protein